MVCGFMSLLLLPFKLVACRFVETPGADGGAGVEIGDERYAGPDVGWGSAHSEGRRTLARYR